MPKRSSKAPKGDLNTIAFNIVQQATGGDVKQNTTLPVKPNDLRTSGVKNPAAVALGKLGGLKGGKARAESLSKTRRSEIAALAAKKRWGNKNRLSP